MDFFRVSYKSVVSQVFPNLKSFINDFKVSDDVGVVMHKAR